MVDPTYDTLSISQNGSYCRDKRCHEQPLLKCNNSKTKSANAWSFKGHPTLKAVLKIVVVVAKKSEKAIHFYQAIKRCHAATASRGFVGQMLRYS